MSSMTRQQDVRRTASNGSPRNSPLVASSPHTQIKTNQQDRHARDRKQMVGFRPRRPNKTAMANTTSPPCHLLSLPLELRLQIYTLLLLLPPYSRHSTHRALIHAAILDTSRQIQVSGFNAGQIRTRIVEMAIVAEGDMGYGPVQTGSEFLKGHLDSGFWSLAYLTYRQSSAMDMWT
ncbi:hypothetical protein MAJ_02003, partial [Metarhizium majus ARSEF 297]